MRHADNDRRRRGTRRGHHGPLYRSGKQRENEKRKHRSMDIEVQTTGNRDESESRFEIKLQFFACVYSVVAKEKKIENTIIVAFY